MTAETATGTASQPTDRSTPEHHAPERHALDQRLSQVLELCRTGRPEEAEEPYRELCGSPPRLNIFDSVSDASTLVVPTSTGYPSSCSRRVSSTMALYFSRRVL